MKKVLLQAAHAAYKLVVISAIISDNAGLISSERM